MLAWACDLILASDDASFRDPTLMMGVLGAEYFMHPWELGTRQAKEFLWTSDWMSAERACQLGMVNRVVPRQQLQATALQLAEEIARRPTFAVRATKLAVNAAQDQQGRWNAIRHSNKIPRGRVFNTTCSVTRGRFLFRKRPRFV